MQLHHHHRTFTQRTVSNHSNAARTLRPLLTAIEMVFGSAAALSATFGYRVCYLPLIWVCLELQGQDM